MNQARNRIVRAVALLKSGVIDFLQSDEIAGRIKRGWASLRHHPKLNQGKVYLETHVPLWKARYKESSEFKDRVWYTGIFGIFLVMVLYFSIGEGPEIPAFKIKENEIKIAQAEAERQKALSQNAGQSIAYMQAQSQLLIAEAVKAGKVQTIIIPSTMTALGNINK